MFRVWGGGGGGGGTGRIKGIWGGGGGFEFRVKGLGSLNPTPQTLIPKILRSLGPRENLGAFCIFLGDCSVAFCELWFPNTAPLRVIGFRV